MCFLLRSITKDTVIVEDLKTADSFIKRLKGLMGKKELSEKAGLLIVPCSCIHTMFMRFPIDVIFLDRDLTVVKIVENMKPWSFTHIVQGSCRVLELNAGQAEKLKVEVGDKLIVQ